MSEVTSTAQDAEPATSHRQALFVMSCIALTVTAMTFAIRAGILAKLGAEFGLSNVELGWINSMAFLGFPLSMIIGGLLYNQVGPRALMVVAFAGHLIGLTLTILASGFWGLLISTFFVGVANGAVEAACNPLVAQAYPENRTAMLNRFHVWFPGGIVLGALTSQAMSGAGLGWQPQIAVMLIPTLVYGAMVWRLSFRSVKAIDQSTQSSIRSLRTPLFLLIAFLMTLTATTELGTQQWVERILGASGAAPMLVLALVTGVMAVGRFFAGPVISALTTIGVLLMSSVLAALGIGLMSVLTGPAIYVAALVFALGVTYFWPTMIGWVSEELPQTGALGMSLVGGAGMFALSIWNPIIGSWIDSATTNASALGLADREAELSAGQSVLRQIVVFPLILSIAFGALLVHQRQRKKHTA